MKTIIKTTVFLIFLIIIVSCDPAYFEDGCHSYAKINNKSTFVICTDFTQTHPDTTIKDINPLRRGRKIDIGKTGKTIGKLSICWEREISNFHYISIFIFDANFMEQNLTNEDFRINETMALQRYDLTLEDLNSLGWTIPYPPDERMKHMKMYPPYGK